MKKLLSDTLSIGLIVTIIFLLLQACEIINWSVVWLLAPLWMPVAIVLALGVVIFIASFIGAIIASVIERKTNKNK